MPSAAQSRLLKDLRRLEMNPPIGISGSPSNSSLFEWDAVIVGPPNSLYEFGIFKLFLLFTENYPIIPPVVRFTSKMFHPNIFPDGAVCTNTLNTLWSPVSDVAAVLISIQALLCEPLLESPVNPVATEFYVQNKKGYAKKVKECVELSLEE